MYFCVGANEQFSLAVTLLQIYILSLLLQFDAKNKSHSINHTMPYHILLQKKRGRDRAAKVLNIKNHN